MREARRIFFERGEAPAGLLREQVLASWRRCRAIGLDPAGPPDLDGVRRDVLETALEREAVLLRAARPVVEAMAAQVEDDPNVVILTDAAGLILMVAGNADFAAVARRREARVGTVLSERVRGTNAPGACLHEAEPLIVSGAEHYLARDACFACSASPIHGPDGRVVGSIDVTGDAREVQPFPVAFPRMGADLIERQLFREAFPLHMLLRFHARPEYVGALGEGLAVLAGDGTMLAVNRAGLRLLALGPAEARGRAFETVFDARFGEVCSLIRRAVQPVLRLHLHTGERIYARLEGGDPAPAAPVEARTVPPAPSMKDIQAGAVRAALDAEGGNLSAAARRLGIARTTLYRKLKGLGTPAV
ncbi:MAG TPA: helix-turn-helix domain-containing protein [Burkholderiales bacterium]|nr:helix-turn-helix domain-containing protein [Burkholderiales bacterium]